MGGFYPRLFTATSRSDHIAGMPNGNSLISQNRKILILNYKIKLSYFLFVVYLYVLCSLKPFRDILFGCVPRPCRTHSNTAANAQQGKCNYKKTHITLLNSYRRAKEIVFENLSRKTCLSPRKGGGGTFTVPTVWGLGWPSFVLAIWHFYWGRL